MLPVLALAGACPAAKSCHSKLFAAPEGPPLREALASWHQLMVLAHVHWHAPAAG
jgi:hypothetical protein